MRIESRTKYAPQNGRQSLSQTNPPPESEQNSVTAKELPVGMPKPPLTHRQTQILSLLADGNSPTEIARRLYIRPSTVRGTLQRAYGRLGAHGQAHAVATALRLGLLQGVSVPPPSPRPSVAVNQGPTPTAAHAATGPLTPRRLEVLRLAACGRSNADIARTLWLTEDAVKSHLQSAYRALGARDRAHAVAICLVRGLIRPQEVELLIPACAAGSRASTGRTR